MIPSDLVEEGERDGILHLREADVPIDSLLSDRIGCRTLAVDTGDLDLAAICPA